MELFQYSFIQRGLAAGAFVAVACSVLGLFLVLRKMSLMGEGLSHVSFGAIALGMFLGVYPFFVAFPVIIIVSVLMLKISQKARLYGDSAIGIFSVLGISSGVMLASLSDGFNASLFGYLFGSILAISAIEVIVAAILSLLVLFVLVFFYRDFFSTTFDEEYAKASGIDTDKVNMILIILTGITVALSVKIVGILLVSALFVLPAVTALQVAHNFKTALALSCIIAVLSVFSGVFLSYYMNMPTGALIVAINAFLFFLSLIYKKVR